MTNREFSNVEYAHSLAIDVSEDIGSFVATSDKNVRLFWGRIKGPQTPIFVYPGNGGREYLTVFYSSAGVPVAVMTNTKPDILAWEKVSVYTEPTHLDRRTVAAIIEYHRAVKSKNIA